MNKLMIAGALLALTGCNAAQGLGKTMIAQNIAHQAVLAGHSVLFTTATKMLMDLEAVHGTPHLFQQRLRKYTRVTLLIVDEVGYLSYDTRAADLLFQVVSERHEKRSTVLTTIDQNAGVFSSSQLWAKTCTSWNGPRRFLHFTRGPLP